MRSRTFRSATLAVSSGVAALSWTAQAQTAPQPVAATASAQTETTGAISGDGIEDIIVTAEKRSVNIQKAPTAITSVSGELLTSRGISNLTQAQVLVPSVKLGQEGSSTQAFIRGVGQTHDSVDIEPQVAINYNSVTMPREATGGANLFDVDRIEILPGPQGTLYGRSATGGVINVEFRRPGHAVGANATAEYGNYDRVHLDAGVDLPLSPGAAMRIAGIVNRQDGYMRTGSGAEKDYGLRASFVADMSDRLDLFAWGSYIAHRGSIPNAVSIPLLNADDPYNDLQPPGLQPFGQNQKSHTHEDIYLAGGELRYRGDGFSVSYIPGFVRESDRSTQALAGLPLYFQYKIRQQSNDIRLSAEVGSRLHILAGAYQFAQTYRDYIFRLPFGNVYDIPLSKEYGVSAYTQGSFSLTDALRLTVGGRYSSTKRHARFNEFNGAFPATPREFAATYNHFDWKVGSEADVGPRSMAYATVQTGFTPGTYNTSPSLPLLPKAFLPTKLTAYTAGLKNRFFDNRVQLNAEGFYYDYRDLLITAFNLLTGQQTVQNAKKVELYGGQIDARFAPTRLTELYASVGYLHARNKDFLIPQFDGSVLNLNGLTPPYSPEWTLNIGGSQTVPLARAGKIVGRVDTHHETSAYSQFDHAPGTRTDGYWKTDLSLTFTPDSGRFSIGAWVRNVENTLHIATVASGGIPGPAAAILERPRTYGLRVSANF